MSKEPIEYLKHIRDESLYILSVINDNLTKEDYQKHFANQAKANRNNLLKHL